VPNSGVGGSVNANRDNTNDLMVDGVTNIDTGSNGGQLATMNIDQIAELKMLTNSQPAEYGRSSDASISVVTKSGSRDLHGTGYIVSYRQACVAQDFFCARIRRTDVRSILSRRAISDLLIPARSRSLTEPAFPATVGGRPSLLPWRRA